MTYKIALDVSPLNDGNSVRGVGHYTQNLLTAIQKEIKINPDYKNYQLDLIQNSQSSLSDYHLVHYPYFDPFKLTLPPKKIPTVVTVHDLIPRLYKKNFPVGIKGELKWLIQKHRLKKSNYLISPSHYAKHSISQILNYPADKIFVTPEAAGPEFRPINHQPTLQTVSQKYNLPSKFILYVGDINWNKNIPGLVKACLSLKFPLVIVGSAAVKKDVPFHPWTQDLLWLQNTASKNPKLITLTGFVPDPDLPVIYNLASIYCQPSFSEGFGLPVVQALSCGTPVAYSQESSLNEIVNYHGQMFNPYSQSSIQNALKTLWQNDTLRQQFSKEGQVRSKIFDWKLTALQTLAVYDLILKYEAK